jgi:hypothetical protein
MRKPIPGMIAAIAIAAIMITSATAATTDNLRRAEIIPTALQGTLSQTVAALEKTVDGDDWIGYSVEPRPGIKVCGGNWNNGNCNAELSDDDNGMSTQNFDDGEDGFEVIRELQILMRVNNDRTDRIRVFTDDCEVKATGVTVHWLGPVSSTESIALLGEYITRRPSTKREREKFHSRAAGALAQHADPAALVAMQQAAESQEDDQLRGEIVFWLGESDDPATIKFLMGLIDDDPSEHVREQAIFAMSNNDSPEAADALISAARNNDDRDVRSKALFWLAQKAGEKAKETLRDAATDDPDQYVKEQAVFALSQLPEDEGVPLLIDVARNNSNAKVREQAIFWLGQSEDPRALTFFEEILSR